MFVDLFPTLISVNSLKDLSPQELDSYRNYVFASEKLVEESIPVGFTTKSSNILDDPIFYKIKEYALYYSKLYFKELGWKEFDIQIQNSWGNILDQNQSIPSHQHTHSFISGVFYPQNSTPLTFFSPVNTNWTFYPDNNLRNYSNQGYRTWISHDFNPSSKDLILFPSWLHHTTMNDTLDRRVSIAFNVIPKGEFGQTTNKIYL